jgi:4-amino-4-deoxy-L-arabinose transferase-like glycosyltransferase
MNIWIFLAAATIIRIILSSLFPLSADESYYWLWSKHLALSYVDHPPMVAYINFLTTLGRENLFMLRLGANLLVLLTSILIYFIGKKYFNEKVAFWSVVLFQLIPHYLIIWLTMFVELPLALFWTASIFILFQIIKSNKPAWWYLLAISLGLGYLSKYTMFLFWPCLALFFILTPKNRFWLKRKEPYLSLLLSALFFLPVLYWNSQHAWISFSFHGAKVTGNPWGANFLTFVGDQLVHFTPFLLFTLYRIFRYSLRKDESTKLLFCFSAPVLILFLIASLKIKIWAHWPAVGYIAALPLTVIYLTENRKSLKKFAIWVIAFSLLILTILFWASPGVLLHQKDYAQNYKLAESLPPDQKIFTKTNVTASLLEFYAKRQTHLSTGFLKAGTPWGENQYEIWDIPNLKPGENIIYFGEDTLNFRDKSAKNFLRITEFPQPKIFLIEDYITYNYKFFMLEGYRKKGSHP